MRKHLVLCATGLALALLVGCPQGSSQAIGVPVTDAAAEKSRVDLDFPSMNPTIGTARLVELLRTPLVHTGRTVRVTGEAIGKRDKAGQDHYGIALYDQGGCCPIAMIEYFPVTTNALPQERARIVLTGTVAIPSKPAYSHFIITGATVRQLNSK